MLAVIISDVRVALKHEREGYTLPQAEDVVSREKSLHISFATLEGVAMIDDALPQGCEWMGIREAHSAVDAIQYELIVKAAELLNWEQSTLFCSVCGSTMKRHTDISRICTSCGREIWPQLQPAIVVLVTRGEEALLVRAKNFKRPFYALVAGFVETGETLEECVSREVREETSLEIKNIRYFGSQSWPFPGQLMIGFTAQYASGNLQFADGELADGDFFTRDNLPPLPTPPSLSRAIIDVWIAHKLS